MQNRLRDRSLVKTIFLGSWVGSIPVFLVIGFLAAFGVVNLIVNGRYVHGFMALIYSPILGLIVTTLAAGFVVILMLLGQWLLSRMDEERKPPRVR